MQGSEGVSVVTVHRSAAGGVGSVAHLAEGEEQTVDVRPNLCWGCSVLSSRRMSLEVVDHLVQVRNRVADTRLDAGEDAVELDRTWSHFAVAPWCHLHQLPSTAGSSAMRGHRDDEDLQHLQVPTILNSSSWDFRRVVGSGLTP